LEQVPERFHHEHTEATFGGISGVKLLQPTLELIGSHAAPMRLLNKNSPRTKIDPGMNLIQFFAKFHIA
jgi:hypothetical protein